MTKRNLWWSVLLVIALGAIPRAVLLLSLQEDWHSEGSDLHTIVAIRFFIGSGLLIWFVHLVEWNRLWPLLVLSVANALWIPVAIGWILTADANGIVVRNGSETPVVFWWISLGYTVISCCLFGWHYWLFKRFAAKRKDP